MNDELITALIRMSDSFFRGKAIWHGALLAHLSDLSVPQALWRPAPQRHCIWEIVRHVALWRNYLIAHATNQPVPEWKSQNWTLPEPADEAAWQADLQRLGQLQKDLTAVFQAKGVRTLLMQDENGKFISFWWVGVFLHDSYHTGQIAYLRALMGLPPVD